MMASQYELEESNQMYITIAELNDLSLTDNMHCFDCPATRLPVEVVIYVMEFLSYADRIAAGRTCKLWYEALRYPKFLNDEKVVVNKHVTGYQNVYQTQSRPYPNLVLIEVEISPKARDFWLRIAPGLKSLYINNCDICEKMFLDILSQCRRLESLALDDCRELFMSGRLLAEPVESNALRETLHGIRELNLSCNRYLCDSLLNRLVASMPKLETISLEGCQISYHAGLFNKYYPEKITAEEPDFASDVVLTFQNFCKIIERRIKTIRVINLGCTLVDSIALCRIAEIEGLCLGKIHMAGCAQLTNVGVISLVHHQPQLSELELSRCARITDEALLQVCTGLPRLRRLGLRGCRAITDQGIEQLCKLEYLRELDISNCDQVTGDGIEKGICYQVNKRFRQLMMEGLTSVTSDTVFIIAKNLPDLTHLNLSYCFDAVTDESVQAIFYYQRCLRWLWLRGCDLLTDAGLTGFWIELIKDIKDIGLMTIVDEEPRLLRISLEMEEETERGARKHSHTEQQLIEVQLKDIQGYSLAHLSSLQEIDIQNCNKISDISLKFAFHHLDLQRLNLSECQQITAEGLCELVAHCPSINTLSLAHCHNVVDGGIESVVQNLKRLKYLDIKGCNQLTGAVVDAVLKHGRQLRHLDVTSCEKMSAAVVAHINRLPATTIFSQAEANPSESPAPPPLPR